MLHKSLVILLTTIWIIFSEFLCYQFLLVDIWREHFQQQNQRVPDNLINVAIWLVWSLCLASIISLLLEKYTLLQACLMSWFIAFVMMWLVLAGLNTLPLKILPYAIPLSLFECFIAGCLLLSLTPRPRRRRIFVS